MEEKEALYYKLLHQKTIQCQLCPHFCTILPNERGRCGVRINKNGKLISSVYSKPCSLNVDPIEKKPLFHFHPGDKTLSIATVGCNFSCQHCQNWEISNVFPEDMENVYFPPEEVIKEAKREQADIISYTYTEPTIFYEYMEDIAKLARKENMKNVTVTNGYINKEPTEEISKYLDATNIDLKSMEPSFYRKICGGRLEPVLDTIKLIKKKKIWIEITNLLIPGLNDSERENQKLVDWVLDNLGDKVPIHFTCFYPTHKLITLTPTPQSKIKRARDIAMESGIKYAYSGNIRDKKGNNTYCHKCNKTLIVRNGFNMIQNNLRKGKCPYCKTKIPGVWS